MDRYTEAFDAAEQARILGDAARAVELYAEADSLAKEFPSVDLVALHHMWGVALTSTGQYEEALTHFKKASSLADVKRNSRTWAAIGRDLALLFLAREQLGPALHEINHSLDYLPSGDPARLAERGASIGVKARIKLAQGHTHAALELFGTAAMLLQRSGNQHYELYNGLHFATALVEHGVVEELTNLDLYFDRVGWLATRYGGKPHRERWQELVHCIREKKGLANPRT